MAYTSSNYCFDGETLRIECVDSARNTGKTHTHLQMYAGSTHLYLTLTDAQIEQLYHAVTARRSKIAQRQAIAAETS